MKSGCHANDETKFCAVKAPACVREEAALCAKAKAQGKAACTACLQVTLHVSEAVKLQLLMPTTCSQLSTDSR